MLLKFFYVSLNFLLLLVVLFEVLIYVVKHFKIVLSHLDHFDHKLIILRRGKILIVVRPDQLGRKILLPFHESKAILC